MKIDENNFIRYLKKKDEKALDYIIERYGALIKSIVKKHLYNLEQVQEECINDILLAIWYHIDNFDENKGSFSKWAGAVSKYKCISYKRKYLNLIETQNIDDMDLKSNYHLEKEIIKNDLNDDIEKLLNNLKEEDKKLFIKHYVEEQDINDISKELNIKSSVIYNRLSRGRSKLRTIYSDKQ